MNNNAEQVKQLKNIEFKVFDRQKLSEGSYIELKDGTINKLSETAIHIKDLLKISQQAKFFKATVNPELLSKFNDGTYSTIIRDSNGHILSHAGFEQLSPINLAPSVIFQALSLATRQYYLYIISEKLKDIKKTVDSLKRDIYEKHIAKLKAIEDEINIKIKEMNNNMKEYDFKGCLEQYRKEINEIVYDCEQKIKTEGEKKIVSSLFNDNIDKLQEKENYISILLTILSICNFFVNFINYLILNIYIENDNDTTIQKELINDGIKKNDSLLKDSTEYYNKIFEESSQLKSSFEKFFYDFEKMDKLPMKDRFKWLLNPQNFGKSFVDLYGIPSFIAKKKSKSRIEKIKEYQEDFKKRNDILQNNIKENKKNIEKLIGDKELIYITDNQQNKRLFMKVS